MKIYKTIMVFLAVFVFAFSFFSCEKGGKSGLSDDNLPDTENGSTAETENLTVSDNEGSEIPNDEDMFPLGDTAADKDGAVEITLTASGAVCDSEKVSVSENTVTISGGGTYIVSGSIPGGQIKVDVGKKDSVCLVFDGADITCKNHAALYVKQADEVIIELSAGSENSLSSEGEFSKTDENNVDSAIFSKSDLVICGDGALTVKSDSGHGITSKDDLIIMGGEIKADASGHALCGKDSVRIADGTFELSSGKDGIHSENADDASLGFVYIKGGEFTVNSDGDGIDASSYAKITGGNFKIKSGDRSTVVHKTEEGFGKGGFGFFRGGTTDGTETDKVSCKGVKAASELVICGGSFAVDSADDAFHSNGNVTVNGGKIYIATGDDGIHADEKLAVNDGTVVITESYEGLEGLKVEISGGDITVKSSDDGINAAGGNDASGSRGMMRPDNFGGDSDSYIKISGGSIRIDADGDGVDSNGDIYVSGGETYVDGPANSANGAIDYENNAVITGGVFVAAGAVGMAQNFGSSSTQGSIMASVSGMQTVTLSDEKGNTLVTFTPTKNSGCIVISCPELVVGGKYTLEVGTSKTEITLTSLIYGGGSGGPGGVGGNGSFGDHGRMDNPGRNGDHGGMENPGDFGDHGGMENPGDFGDHGGMKPPSDFGGDGGRSGGEGGFGRP